MQENSGFTLIELLVVILIIGILSAVALPQYQKAVMKSRMSSLLPLVKSIDSAQQVYYLANGSYAVAWEDLDVSMPGGGVPLVQEDRNYLIYSNFSCSLSSHDSVYCTVGNSSSGIGKTFSSDNFICWAAAGTIYDKVCQSLTGKTQQDSGGDGDRAYFF